MNEYRAVFQGPNGGGTYGPARNSLAEAAEDRPARSEETHEVMVGIQTRRAEPWRSIPLNTLLKELKVKK